MKTKTPTILPTLPKWGERNLIKLIEFLKKLPPKKFDFGGVVAEGKQNGHVCGTVCCAIGWTPAVFPRRIQWFEIGDGAHLWDRKLQVSEAYSTIASSLFGMDVYTAEDLFMPGHQSWVHANLRDVSYAAKPSTVARMLRKYLKLTHTPQ